MLPVCTGRVLHLTAQTLTEGQIGQLAPLTTHLSHRKPKFLFIRECIPLMHSCAPASLLGCPVCLPVMIEMALRSWHVQKQSPVERPVAYLPTRCSLGCCRRAAAMVKRVRLLLGLCHLTCSNKVCWMLQQQLVADAPALQLCHQSGSHCMQIVSSLLCYLGADAHKYLNASTT